MRIIWRHFSPLFVFHIRGDSMKPAYKNNENVLVLRYIYRFIPPRTNEVVIAKDPRDSKFLIKRITKQHYGKIFLSGDNSSVSTDSRQFGMIQRSDLIGKVICKV